MCNKEYIHPGACDGVYEQVTAMPWGGWWTDRRCGFLNSVFTKWSLSVRCLKQTCQAGTRSMDAIWTLVVCVGVVFFPVPGSTQESPR